MKKVLCKTKRCHNSFLVPIKGSGRRKEYCGDCQKKRAIDRQKRYRKRHPEKFKEYYEKYFSKYTPEGQDHRVERLNKLYKDPGAYADSMMAHIKKIRNFKNEYKASFNWVPSAKKEKVKKQDNWEYRDCIRCEASFKLRKKKNYEHCSTCRSELRRFKRRTK